MGVVSWAIADVTQGPSVLAISLVHAERKLVALVRRDRVNDPAGSGRTDRLAVRFSSSSSSSSSPRAELYARAEAARLYAQACDTAGDLATGGGDALDVRDPGMVGPEVELIGRDAGVVVGTYFDDATDAMMDLLF